MQKRIFNFKSGYTIAIRPEYSPALIDAMVRGWAEDNPQPEPPTQTVKVKGGTTERPLVNSPQHQENLQVWAGMMQAYRNEMTIRLAFDPASIDRSIVDNARAKMAEFGGKGTADDVSFYLELVTNPGKGQPGDPDYEPNEMEELARFALGERGPSGALIEHLLKTTFQNGLAGKENGEIRGHLVGSTTTQGQAEIETGAAADALPSG